MGKWVPRKIYYEGAGEVLMFFFVVVSLIQVVEDGNLTLKHQRNLIGNMGELFFFKLGKAKFCNLGVSLRRCLMTARFFLFGIFTPYFMKSFSEHDTSMGRISPKAPDFKHRNLEQLLWKLFVY